MSTLRVSNIEAKANASSPTVDEKVKITDSQGRVLMQVDGKTSGITTVGINTTGNTFTVDANSGVTFSGIVTATGGFSGNLTGSVNLTTGITTVAAGSTSAPSITPTGDSNTGIFFPSADTIAFGEGGSESARFDSNGRLGIGTQIPSAVINVRSSAAELARFTNTGSNGGDWEIKLGGGGFEDRKFMLTDKFGGTDNVRVSVDSSGRVTKPYQPVFSAYRNTNQSITANTATKVLLDATEFNIGSHFDTSTSRFNVPVTGSYLFTAAIQFQTSGSPHTNFYKNGSDSNNGWIDFGPNVVSSTQSRIMYLTAGDYIELYGYHTANTVMSAARTRMTGFFLG